MRKLLVSKGLRVAGLAALLALVSATAEAQAPIRIGIKGGLAFATQSDNAAPDFDTKTGFTAGASLPIRLASIFDIQPEALFVQKGGEGQNVRFFEVPLFLRLNIPVGAVRPFALAGPSVGFRLSCDFGGVSDCDALGIEKREYGVALGGGVRLGSRMGFTLEGRYSWGLKDINNLTAGVDVKTRTFLLLAGIEF
jgi:hypothetical protein